MSDLENFRGTFVAPARYGTSPKMRFKRSPRAGETPEQAEKRREAERIAKRIKRANESAEEAERRRKQAREQRRESRAKETPEEKERRKASDRERKRIQRAQEKGIDPQLILSLPYTPRVRRVKLPRPPPPQIHFECSSCLRGYVDLASYLVHQKRCSSIKFVPNIKPEVILEEKYATREPEPERDMLKIESDDDDFHWDGDIMDDDEPLEEGLANVKIELTVPEEPAWDIPYEPPKPGMLKSLNVVALGKGQKDEKGNVKFRDVDIEELMPPKMIQDPKIKNIKTACGKRRRPRIGELDGDGKPWDPGFDMCHLCGKTYAKGNSLKTHLELHSDLWYTCDLCGQKSKTHKHLFQHMRNKHLQKTFVCEICGKRFGGASYLHVHVLSHLTPKEHKCRICSAKFKQPAGLTKHMENIHNDPYYYCEICEPSVRFNTYSAWYSHNKHNHEYIGKKKEQFQCKNCGRAYKTSTCFKSHVCHFNAVHKLTKGEGERKNPKKKLRYQCSVCGYRTVGRNLLKSHVRAKHTDQKPFSCKFCNVHFSWRNSYVSHFRTYHPEKVHKVSDGKVFKYYFEGNDDVPENQEGGENGGEMKPPGIPQQDVNRKRHVFEDKVMSHQCPICGFRTSGNEKLKRHMNGRHGGEKQFECTICDVKFAWRDSYISHFRSFHPEKITKEYQDDTFKYVMKVNEHDVTNADEGEEEDLEPPMVEERVYEDGITVNE